MKEIQRKMCIFVNIIVMKSFNIIVGCMVWVWVRSGVGVCGCVVVGVGVVCRRVGACVFGSGCGI